MFHQVVGLGFSRLYGSLFFWYLETLVFESFQKPSCPVAQWMGWSKCGKKSAEITFPFDSNVPPGGEQGRYVCGCGILLFINVNQCYCKSCDSYHSKNYKNSPDLLLVLAELMRHIDVLRVLHDSIFVNKQCFCRAMATNNQLVSL